MTQANENHQTDNIAMQVARLQAQVETLLKERVAPDVANIAGRAEAVISDANTAVHEQAAMFCAQVRRYPLVSLAVAAGIGWVIGRAMR